MKNYFDRNYFQLRTHAHVTTVAKKGIREISRAGGFYNFWGPFKVPGYV